MKRASYQNGSVVLKQRALGPDVWVLRYMDGEIQRAKRLGTVDKYPTRAGAERAAARYREEINQRLTCILVSGLCDRYELEGMPARTSTSSPYRSYLKRVREHWGTQRLDAMARDVMAIELWINSLRTLPTRGRKPRRGSLEEDRLPGKPARDASKRTKLHMKQFVHRLFECAIKWGYLPMQRNPIGLVEIKGKARRTRPLVLLTGDQYRRLIADPQLESHVRTMITVAMLLGLRASEILGLRWEDIDFARGVLHVRRSSVGAQIDDTKTEGSEQELPMHDDLAQVLRAWREEQTPIEGWLFGNITTERPFWRDSLQVDHLIPAGRRVGIANLGWHAFRHTYRAMMRELNISLEEQRTLMRHEDIRTTIGYGGKTPADAGRPANTKVVELLRKPA